MFSVLVEDAVRHIPVTRSFSFTEAGFLSGRYILQQTLDISDYEDEWSCFQSMQDQKSFVKLLIPWSMVTHVNILNSGDSEY